MDPTTNQRSPDPPQIVQRVYNHPPYHRSTEMSIGTRPDSKCLDSVLFINESFTLIFHFSVVLFYFRVFESLLETFPVFIEPLSLFPNFFRFSYFLIDIDLDNVVQISRYPVVRISPEQNRPKSLL